MARLRSLLLAMVLTGVLGTAAAAAPRAPIASDRQVLVLLKLPAQHFRTTAGYADSYGDGASRAARKRIATRLAREHGLTLVTDWPMPLVGLDCYVMSVPEGRSTEAAALDLSRDRAVDSSEPMHVYAAQADTPPNDPLFRAQPVARAWRLEALHEVATGRNVKVAVIDSGVDATHPDLAGQVETRQDFALGHPGSAEAHGTGVAGIIAAIEDNQIGIAGVAPGARLMALRACWQDAQATLCDTLSLAKAVHFALDHSAQVINLSLAGPPDTLLGRLIDVAVARGVVVVGAVDPDLPGGGFPASHRGVVAVTLSAAPGRDVPTTQPGGTWGLVSGSSYSAAHVSGLFALMRERTPGVRPLALVQAAGGGAIDACATLSKAPCGRPVALTAMPRP